MNSDPVTSEVLNIFFSMTCEYKPKFSVGLFSLFFSLNCKEIGEGADLPAVQLLRDSELVPAVKPLRSVIVWSSVAFHGRLLHN